MPTRTPTSPATPQAPVSGAYRHLACVQCLTRSSSPGDLVWLAACYQVTLHVQRLGHDAALLDLGSCTDEEARSVMQALVTRLQAQQIRVRAAIGPSGTLAQFALLHAPSNDSVSLVTTEQVSTLLQRLSIHALARLRLARAVAIKPEVVAKLEGYGVRTVAHLARFDEEHLRRQFGARIGTVLATLARGQDPLPFQATAAPLQLPFRLRLQNPVTLERLLIGLPAFTSEIAKALSRRVAQMGRLEVRLRWESGSTDHVSRTLPQPLASSRSLAETIERLLTPLMQSNERRMVDDLRVILSHITPRYPAQDSFWPERVRHLAAANEVAALLAQRHGKPMLFRGVQVAPDAIFEHERYRLTPLDADVLEESAARPSADILDGAEKIPHGIHWW